MKNQTMKVSDEVKLLLENMGALKLRGPEFKANLARIRDAAREQEKEMAIYEAALKKADARLQRLEKLSKYGPACGISEVPI